MSRDKNKKVILNSSGSTLIGAIVAIVVLGALGVGMQQMSSSAVYNQLMFNQANQARNLAYTGKNYLLGLSKKATIDNSTLDTSKTTINNNLTKTIPGVGTFEIYNLVWSGTTLACNIKGTTANGQASYLLPSSVSVVFPDAVTEWNGGDYVISSGGALNGPQNAYINGSVAGTSITLNNNAVVEGNVISETSVNLAQNSITHGFVCAASGNVQLNNNAVVDEDVSANGYIQVSQNAIIKQNAYATSYIQMSNNATIQQKGQAGGAINRAQNDYIGTPLQYTMPTVTCPSTNAPIAPTITNTGTLPAPASTSSSPLASGQYTNFTINQNGSAYLKSGTYIFSSIQTNNNAKLYLDISTGGDLTILVTGNINIGQNTNVFVKTTSNGAFRSVVEDTDRVVPHSDAAKIYIGSNTDIVFNNNTGWFGTIYAKNSLSVSQNFILIGTLASPGTVSLNNNLNVVEYVLSNYARSNWR
ncbi:hypothetical protein GTA51_12995 [Desulfovibrio aerotolerans]|uniref:Uncharacterized protein n=1 Tax=Solidesulfovibrio aerotolerans TaxID=295255 RepID=A0A7C9IM10_9BACT|nr:hypothetical protein [Solidesulfovibrio aerotolerans]MYL84045.1 hypothetical protein [Solidesulfovibrio aerotolerans]